MSTRIIILDTSYLIELVGCGRDSNPAASKTVKSMFKSANRKRARFFVPLPVLFELGDHIADVAHHQRRSELTSWLVGTVGSCIAKSLPFTITPADNPGEILPKLMARFKTDCPKVGTGLVDCFTAMEAHRLKSRIHAIKPTVHIWTNDRPLKSREPDPESNPFLW